MKRFISIFSLCIFSTLTIAQIQPLANLSEFEQKLKNSVSTLTSIESDFLQIKHLDMFNEDVQSSGKFAYLKENKISLKYTKPLDYLVVINNDKLKIVADGKKSVMSLGSNKMMAGMKDMITACMVGDLNRMKDGYVIDYKENTTYYQITITPKSQLVRDYVSSIRILLNKIDMSVDELYMFENEDDYTKYIFKNKSFNQLKDESTFSID